VFAIDFVLLLMDFLEHTLICYTRNVFLISWILLLAGDFFTQHFIMFLMAK